MRRLTVAALLTMSVALPLRAADRSHSYFTFEDGGTIVRQGEDGREVDARVNLPLYPGDEIMTSRRGRAEVRLSDGNFFALDRSTAVHFRSILDSYDGDASQTVAELRYGHVMLQRTVSGNDITRLDTANASYAASAEAIYAVESDDSGKDRVTVFDGSVEVRTPARTSILRAGDEAGVDGQGLYGLVSQSNVAADDFERWFLKRGETYRRASSRYVDRSLAYSDSDLESNGSWIYTSGYSGWAWRPRVASGWRPYYYGSWVTSPSGCLVWVSDEPWGWVPYHYGRWVYDPVYGWIWLPGAGYAPAWVYWLYGSDYFGWAPAGWYDCYRPYYDWCYRPYARAGLGFGFGFYGRIHLNEIDLRPWTFINAGAIVSSRVDRAALTTDAIRDRLTRTGGGFATVSGAPARFTRSDLKDPAAAIGIIARRGIGSGTGKEGSGTPADLTAFFRRDPELSPSVRDHVVRARPTDGVRSVTPVAGAPSTVGGIVNRGDGWRGSGVQPGAGAAPANPGVINRGGDRGTQPAPGTSPGVINRGTTQPVQVSPRDGANGRDTKAPQSQWRDRIERPVRTPDGVDRAPAPVDHQGDQSWRGRVAGRGETGPVTSPDDRRGEIPRKVIDRIGGPRVYSGDGSARSRDTAPPRDSTPRSTAGERQRGSAPPPPPPPPPRSSGGGQSSGSGGHSSSGSSGHSSSGSSGGHSGSSSGGHSSSGSSSGSGSHSSSSSSGSHKN